MLATKLSLLTLIYLCYIDSKDIKRIILNHKSIKKSLMEPGPRLYSIIITFVWSYTT